ncbi:MAG TPA: hypothetical protein VGF28_04100 [Thermoanaerobaculia bacterium]|jgi:hypothetical protein
MKRLRGLLLLVAGLHALGCMDGPVVQKARPPVVEKVGRMPGPDDLVHDSRHRRLLVSSHDRRNEAGAGRIFAVDLEDFQRGDPPHGRPLKLDFVNLSSSFQPHGIALLEQHEPPLLFVINHASSPESIDVFEVYPEKLRLRERLTGAAIDHPNDLDVRRTADGGYELWVTNPARGRKLAWELLIGPHSSYVAHIRSGRATRTYGFRYANGVAYRPSGQVWVASSVDQKLLRLADPTDEIELDSVAHNITSDGPVTMLVTAGGSASGLLRYLRAGEQRDYVLPRSPTLVWRVYAGEPPTTTLLFEDDGRRISGGSSAVCVDGTLFIGQVFDDFVAAVRGVC